MAYDPEDRRSYHREYARGKRATGICTSGGHPAEPGKSRCKKCNDEFNAKLKAKRDERDAAGLCPLCPDSEIRPLVENRSACQFHLDKQKEVGAFFRPQQ